ncbi:T9SS type A sorting domain-containing protein, partial [candidate division KSB1 bacterium]|nr:T9SS type A sorting domain-containing protein [candidate division KSB1 bacterium]
CIEIDPSITVTPATVESDAIVTVRVKPNVPVHSWDVWLYYADGRVDSVMLDEVVAEGKLLTEPEYEFSLSVEQFELLEELQQDMTLEFRIVTICGEFRSAQASLTIQQPGEEEDVKLSRNVFRPDRDNRLEIEFKLDTDQNIDFELYDITGSYVTKIHGGEFKTGWNTLAWDGLTANGQKVGSGMYIITVRSSTFKTWKKVMVVR